MEKYICPVCGKELGLTSIKSKIIDGYICSKCLSAADIPLTTNLKGYTEERAVALVNRRASFGKFRATKKAGGRKLEVDEANELFKLNGHIYEYSNLLGFEMVEDGGTVVKTGLGRAVGGGFLFGPVGALVGGMSGKKKSSKTCYSLQISIGLRDTFMDTEYLDFINLEEKKAVGTDSKEYRRAMADAQECMDALQAIGNINASRERPQPAPNPEPAPAPGPAPAASGTSAADEIRKYKELLDEGIITQEEFDAKKKQLLGL